MPGAFLSGAGGSRLGSRVYSDVVGAEITERHSVTPGQLKPMIGGAVALIGAALIAFKSLLH